jgi:hypothetical protein
VGTVEVEELGRIVEIEELVGEFVEVEVVEVGIGWVGKVV